MRKRLIWTLALGAAFAVAVAAVAVAEKPTVIRAGNLILKINGGVTPKALPKKKMAPITLRISADLSTVDGSHPPAAKSFEAEFDKNGAVNAKGLAVCRQGQLEARDTKSALKACKKSLVGRGGATAEVAFPESKPFTAKGPLLIFNGGVRGKTTTLLVHVYANVPAPTAFVTPVKVTRIKKGRYGLKVAAKIPVIAGGFGSVIHFAVKSHRLFKYKGKKRSYFLARCPTGRFFAKGNVSFKDGTRLAGTVIRRCKPKR